MGKIQKNRTVAYRVLRGLFFYSALYPLSAGASTFGVGFIVGIASSLFAVVTAQYNYHNYYNWFVLHCMDNGFNGPNFAYCNAYYLSLRLNSMREILDQYGYD